MSLNFEMKDKFLTKLELFDLFLIKTLTYLTSFIALISALGYAFSVETPDPNKTLTAADQVTRSIELHHMYFSIFLFFYALIFLFFADGFSEKFGFVKFKKLSVFLVLLLIVYPFITLNAFPDPYGLLFSASGILLSIFTIIVVFINTQHQYVQDHLLERKKWGEKNLNKINESM